LSGDEDTAEEIVQRVLIRALDRLHTYRGEAALLTWICTLCRREIAARLERAGRAHDISLSDDRPEMRALLDALTSVDGSDPEAALSRRELSGLVQLTLDYRLGTGMPSSGNTSRSCPSARSPIASASATRPPSLSSPAPARRFETPFLPSVAARQSPGQAVHAIPRDHERRSGTPDGGR
jgi:hypothetical protein